MKPFRFSPSARRKPAALFKSGSTLCAVVLSAVVLPTAVILASCRSAPLQNTGLPLPTDTQAMLESVFADGVVMQAAQNFPIPMKDYDASILPNNYLSFIAYKGQARIYFWAQNLSSFTLYINNRQVPAKNLCTDMPVCFDASPYIQNGINTLTIANLVPSAGAAADHADSKPEEEPLRTTQDSTVPHSAAAAQTGSQPSLQVRIPYPVIIGAQGLLPGMLQKSPTPPAGTPYSTDALALVDQLLTAETECGFPGAQLVIIKNGQMIKNAAYGTISRVDSTGTPLDSYIPVTQDTLFDIASNTKMYAVNFALQKLVSEKQLFLTDTIQQFFPQFKDAKKDRITGKADITVFDLLTHQSGFPAGSPYTQKIAKLKNADEKTHREHTLDLIMTTPLVYKPRTSVLYSDINYMLLTYIIEKITGSTLADYVTAQFYRPLQLERISFTPLQRGFTLDEIAATEIYAKPRTAAAAESGQKTELIHGTVHDGEAYYALEEMSGHAGLFANAASLAVLAQVMLNNGGYGTMRFFDPSVAAYFTAQQSLVSSFGLGWRRQGTQEYSWAFSPLSSGSTFGHTGWTGALTVIDPAEHLIIILLTNAKNTAPAHNTRNSRFEGDYYLVKRYGAITTLIYEAFRQPPQSKLDSLLIELAQKKYEMLLEIKAFNNQGYRNDLAAIIKTIQLRAAGSAALRAFLNTDTAHAILSTLKE